jgi:hypothetical protein
VPNKDILQGKKSTLISLQGFRQAPTGRGVSTPGLLDRQYDLYPLYSPIRAASTCQGPVDGSLVCANTETIGFQTLIN